MDALVLTRVELSTLACFTWNEVIYGIILPTDCCLGFIHHIVLLTSSFSCTGTSWDRRLAPLPFSCHNVGVLIFKVTSEADAGLVSHLGLSREETSLIPCCTKESPVSFKGQPVIKVMVWQCVPLA